MRTTPWPQIGWSSISARRMPRPTVITSTPTTMKSVLKMAGQNAGSVTKKLKLEIPAKPEMAGLVRR
jgi:hypothetical protein